MLKQSLKYFPWRKNNQIDVLKNGIEFYIAMINAINHAHEYVFFETYFVESGNITSRFIKALINADQRNVKVFLILDAMGSRSLTYSDLQEIQTSGIHLLFYNPLKLLKTMNNFFRDHRKILLIDSHTVFIGGAGLSDVFVGGNYWRDNMFRIQGDVVEDWYQLFCQHWSNGFSKSLPKFDNDKKVEIHNEIKAKVIHSRGRFFNLIKKSIIAEINNSHSQVWLATAYFIPSRPLRRAIISAANRGVIINIIVPSKETDNQMVRNISHGYYHRLLKHGVQIFEYQNHFIHSKILLVDEWVSIGSSNMDRWGAHWNLEANLEVKDKRFSETIYAMMKDDQKHCLQITFKQWCARPMTLKFKTQFWKYFGKLLSFIGLRK